MVKVTACQKKFAHQEPCWWWQYWTGVDKCWSRVEVYIDLYCGENGTVYCLDCAEQNGIVW